MTPDDKDEDDVSLPTDSVYYDEAGDAHPVEDEDFDGPGNRNR